MSGVRPHKPLLAHFSTSILSLEDPQDQTPNDNNMQPTPVLLKRIARMSLNTKQVNKGFYKGTGSGSMGSHTKYGGYRIDWDKVRTYVVPKNLKDFKVTGQLKARED